MKINITLLFVLYASLVSAQGVLFPFQNPDFSPKQRVEDLLDRLTLEEKVSQMQDVSPAIGRLNIPEYNWWNECLHGVARAGNATSFPQAIGMAATWNTELMHQVASTISTEARAKFNVSIREGRRNRYMGLTMWTPNINIFRDPRWGRGQETYGEDPYLTSCMGLAFVKGLQGDDAEYLKVIATPKHFAVHSGPEYNRHSFNAITDKKDLWETYLPAFEATVVDGKAYSVMSAYNRYLGESATASKLLLTDILRKKWGFKGYVVSDCGAVYDIYKFHNIVETAEEAAALAVRAGCDLNCGNSYGYLLNAAEKGLIREDEIDISLRRLLTAKVKLGLFNPIDKMPFSELGKQNIESNKNKALALQMARESLVLLKNSNKVLPLSKKVKSIAVIGPTANDRHMLLGNYFGVPSHRTSILEGIKNKVSKRTEVHYFKGVNIADDKPVYDVVSSDLFKGKIKAEYYNNNNLEGQAVCVEEEDIVDFEWGGAAPVSTLSPGRFSIRYSGVINIGENNLLTLSIQQTGGTYDLKIDGEKVLSGSSRQTKNLEAGCVVVDTKKDYKFELEYRCTNEWMASLQLMYHQDEQSDEKTLMGIVDKSDVVVFVGGISARLEGEEMPVDIDGFHKGDRTHLKLPEGQANLLKRIRTSGKPVIMVLTTGSAIALNWAEKETDAIMLAWYPGQEGGDAVADALFGNYNPSGKLPITFYRSVNDLPDFEDYSMKGRTYRYFKGSALYPFGYGLSYTDFTLSKPMLEKNKISRNDSVGVSVMVENKGIYDGETVIQVYVKDLNSRLDTPIKTLRKFKKIDIEKGENVKVEFLLQPEDFAFINKEGDKVCGSGNFEIFVGEDSSTKNKAFLHIR